MIAINLNLYNEYCINSFYNCVLESKNDTKKARNQNIKKLLLKSITFKLSSHLLYRFTEGRAIIS